MLIKTIKKGSASLVLALILGRRKDFDIHHGEVPPSNSPLASIGAALLWMGTNYQNCVLIRDFRLVWI